MVERFDDEDYSLEGFSLEMALYLPHVSVTAGEAKERKLLSENKSRWWFIQDYLNKYSLYNSWTVT